MGKSAGCCVEGLGLVILPSQTNDIHNWYLPLLSLTLDMTRIRQGLVSSPIRSWCQQPVLPLRQYHKFVMSVGCHKYVPILIWPYMLWGHKRPIRSIFVYIYIYIYGEAGRLYSNLAAEWKGHAHQLTPIVWTFCHWLTLTQLCVSSSYMFSLR